MKILMKRCVSGIGPYVFDFDNDLRLINDYFLGDPEEIKKLMEAVAKQGQKK